MPEIIQETFRDSPFLLQWYSWGVIVGFLFTLGVTLWMFVDAQRNGREETLWKSLAAVASVLAVPALLARLHAGFAYEMRDSLMLVAALSIAAVLLGGGATIAYAMSATKAPLCPVCFRPQQIGWSICPHHLPPAGASNVFGNTAGVSSGGMTGGTMDIDRPIVPVSGASSGGPASGGVSAGPGRAGNVSHTVIGLPRRGGVSPGKRRPTIIIGDDRPRAHAWLVITGGDYDGTQINLSSDEDKVIIGSDGELSDQVVDDDSVSGEHLSIRLDRSTMAYILTDLDTTNGTLLNGKRIEREQLVSNDVIKIGRTTMRFIAVPMDTPASDAGAANATAAPVNDVTARPTETAVDRASYEHEAETLTDMRPPPDLRP